MLITDSRRATRGTSTGVLVPLAEQDRSRWNRAIIAEGMELAQKAWSPADIGTYQIQAAIAALHGSSPSFEQTDWEQIAALYFALEYIQPSSGPVLLSRVVAVAHAFGADQAFELLERLDQEHQLLQNPLTRQRGHAIRAHLQERVGRIVDARVDYLAAAELTKNDFEIKYLVDRADPNAA